MQRGYDRTADVRGAPKPRLSNEFGSTPLIVGAATLAFSSDAATVQPKSLRALMFNGRSSITIPPGAPVVSDPVDLAIASGAEVSISLYLPQRVATPTLHGLALKRAVKRDTGRV